MIICIIIYMKNERLYTIKTIGWIMMLSYESTIGRADVKGKSTRVIIPREIVKILDLEWGDKIVWNANITEKDVTITVEPLKKESDNK